MHFPVGIYGAHNALTGKIFCKVCLSTVENPFRLPTPKTPESQAMV